MATEVSRGRLRAVAARQRTEPKEAQVVRFDAHQRIQHFLMMSSFIVLALTGLPQRFSELTISQWWVEGLGGLETVRTIHRVAAVVMLSDCAYHVGYLVYRIGVQRRFGCLRMVPTFKDVGDALGTVRYFLGLADEKPQFDRFNYLEKFDYWAVFWGIAIIGGSGLMLMFPVAVTKVLPGEAVSVALILHADEAILAVGWILVMHMFNVHLAPWVFPFNPAIFTGKMSARQYAEDHPLEWASLQASGGTGAEDATPKADHCPSRVDDGAAQGPDIRERTGKRSAGGGGVLAARARTVAALVGERTSVIRQHPLLPLVVVIGLVMAGPLGWSSGNNGSQPVPEPTSTPTPLLTTSRQVAPTPAPEPKPTEPPALVHRPVVLERFLCEDCHGVESGWVTPDGCELQPGQACESCHTPASEPSPVSVHAIPGDTATQGQCALCHGDIARSTEQHLMAPVVGPEQACSTCHDDQPADPPGDHTGRSVGTCTVCHETRTLLAQAVPHRVEGWEECSFCHSDGRLAPVDGGHYDLSDDDCTQCHDAVHSPPNPRTFVLDYSGLTGGCTSCHSDSLLTPLAAHDAARDEGMCAVCHSHSAIGTQVAVAPSSAR